MITDTTINSRITIEPAVDVCVVGGGIQGAGVAQAAAASGLSVALIEKSDWGAGTSSKSSKLIHGGLRYLQSADFALVRESLRERRTLLNIAADIVKPNWFYLPVYEGSAHAPWKIRLGLILYRLLAGRNNLGSFKQIPKSDWGQLEGLNTFKLRAVFAYQDAQTDDRQLTQRVVKSAEKHGATLYCPFKFTTAEKTTRGYRVTMTQNDVIKTINCRYLVNAAGPWVNRVADKIDPKPSMINIDLVQGTHIEFSQQLSERCFYLEAQQDRRAVFVLPFKGGTMVGTTEKLFDANPDSVSPSADEVSYLTQVVQDHFPHFNHRPNNAWAGLRVLPATEQSPFKRSREVRYGVSESYLAIYGGKLTGYRATAAKVMAKVLVGLQMNTTHAVKDTSKIKL